MELKRFKAAGNETTRNHETDCCGACWTALDRHDEKCLREGTATPDVRERTKVRISDAIDHGNCAEAIRLDGLLNGPAVVPEGVVALPTNLATV